MQFYYSEKINFEETLFSKHVLCIYRGTPQMKKNKKLSIRATQRLFEINENWSCSRFSCI